MATFHEREDMLYEILDHMYVVKKELLRDRAALTHPDMAHAPSTQTRVERLDHHLIDVYTHLEGVRQLIIGLGPETSPEDWQHLYVTAREHLRAVRLIVRPMHTVARRPPREVHRDAPIPTVPPAGAGQLRALRVAGPGLPHPMAPPDFVPPPAAAAAAPRMLMPLPTGLMAPPAPPAPVAPTPSYPAPWANEPQAPEGTPNEDLCTICQERRVMTATQCGHMYSCVACVLRTRPATCGICQQRLTAVLRVYR